MKILTFILFALMFSISGWTQSNCPQFRESAKPCPTSGTTLLDETFPVSTYVISVKPVRSTEASRKVPKDYILKILESYHFSASSPNFVIPAEDTNFQDLQAALQDEIAKSKGRIPASIMNKVIQAPQPEWTWQQDYFESFFDPASGRPVLRNIENYYGGGRDYLDSNNITNAMPGCGISQGPTLRSSTSSFGSGEMGGNIEGLPGGFCIKGDNQSLEFARQYCGSDDNIVTIDTSWLRVGHVDEIFKVVPTHRPGVPAECNFSLMFASPDKAMELLEQPRSANHTFFSGDYLSAGASEAELESFRNSRGGESGLFCQYYRANPVNAPSNGNKNRNGTTPGKANKAFIKFKEFIIDSAYASTNSCPIENLTNDQFVKGIKADASLVAFNRAVQNSLNRSKALILQKIYERLPQCKKHESIIEAPNLFTGTPRENADGTFDTSSPPLNARADAIVPNPTNSVLANNDLVISDPQNPLFRNYLSDELKKRGSGAKFIDTWDYAHVGKGNVHCSSHSLTYCSPAGSR